MTSEIELGYEVGSGDLVKIPLAHTCVTGVTQAAGKTTTLEAIIQRSGMRAVTFVTKRSEFAFQAGLRIPPYFKSRHDWEFVSSVLGSRLNEKLKFQRSWIMKLCRGAKSLEDVYERTKAAQKAAKRSLDESVYTELVEYFELVLPELRSMNFSDKLRLGQADLNVMDLSTYSLPLQMLVIASVLEWIHQHETGVLTVIPEAWEMIPARRSSPVTRAAETLIRKSTAVRNFVLIDSQDAAGISIDVRRQVHVWILGVQREANEIRRALESVDVPGAQKLKDSDIRGLGRGEFYVCYGREVRKVYVRPIWMHQQSACAVARGEESAEYLARARTEAIADFDKKRPKLVPGTSYGEFQRAAPVVLEPPIMSDWKAKFEASETERLALQSRVDALEADIASARFLGKPPGTDLLPGIETRAQLMASPENSAYRAFREAFRPPDLAGPLDKEALFQEFRERLLAEPTVLRVLAAQPEIQIENRKEVLQLSIKEPRGKLAQLLHGGFFERPATGSAAFSELKKRGQPVAKGTVYDACKFLAEKGFLYVLEDGFQEVPGVRKRIQVSE
jgi:hypothetical protein